MRAIVKRWPVLAFLTCTWMISLLGFGAAVALFGPDFFDNPAAIPLALLVVWSPNLAALLVARAEGTLDRLRATLRFSGGPSAWLAASLPLLILVTLVWSDPPAEGARPGLGLTVALLMGNLILGPLGEEVGWRAFLLERLVPRRGWITSALLVGVIWALWHAPLWLVPSPQSAIPFRLFFATVMCYSLIMTALWRAGRGSLWLAIWFHLGVNFAVGWAEVAGMFGAAEFFSTVLPVYAGAAALSALYLATGHPESR